MDFRASSLKAHLRQADRLGALYSIFLGDDEVANGSSTVRNMQNKSQENVALSDLSATLRARLAGA
jgi:histidyl-tRNA synthetase